MRTYIPNSPVQIDVAVNAPEAGIIKEFLANEEDTVTVGQDLVKLEISGAAGEDKKQGSSEPKTSASKEQATSSDPQPQRPEPRSMELENEKERPSPPSPPPYGETEPGKQVPVKNEPRRAEEPSKPSPARSSSDTRKSERKNDTGTSSLGNRDERRVSKI